MRFRVWSMDLRSCLVCRLSDDVRHGDLGGIAACLKLLLLHALVVPPRGTEQAIEGIAPEVQ